MNACPSRETLTSLLDESLPAEAFREVESHIEGCPACRRTLDELTGVAEREWLAAAWGDPESSLPASQTEECQTSAALPVVPGYEVLGVIGHGGFGVVYQARQVGLDRMVAIKVLKHGPFALAHERDRFLREAQAAARLHHPHIVQVHAIGEVEGLPYFSMELLDRGSLARQLDGTPQPPREAARLVETLAVALHAAHGQSIVHRDLKPSNVLLTADDTPKIADFGMAKLLDSDQGQTASQSVLGTPSYLAPEVAAGGAKQVGPPADVYSLGAILYELLTGRPPFKAATPFETLLQVREQEPVGPRQLQPKVPADLETICLKCLQKDPRQRYPSAAALAEDLRRFLDGAPIQARPVSWAERLGRWCRRKPLIAGLAAALLLLMVGSLVSITSLWRLAEARSAAALREKEKADRHREQAEIGFALAERAVKDYLVTVGDSPELKNTPGMEPFRRKLLLLALDYYREFADTKGDDPSLQRKVANAYGRIAQVNRFIKDYQQARAAGEKAASLLEGFLRDNPNSVEDLHRLAWVWSDLGLTLASLGQAEEELKAYEKALALRERILAIDPSHPKTEANLAWSYSNLGEHYGTKGNLDKARAYFQNALARWRHVCETEPANDWARRMWALTCGNQALVEEMTDHDEAALLLYQQSRDRYVGLASKLPNDLDVGTGLGYARLRMGQVYRRLSRKTEALASFHQAALPYETLLRMQPAARQRLAAGLVNVYSELGRLQREMGEPAHAAATALKRRDLCGADSKELYKVACELALCASLAGRSPSAEGEHRRHADLAVETLGEAIRHGFRNWKQLAEDPNLTSLRARPDFQELLRSATPKQ